MKKFILLFGCCFLVLSNVEGQSDSRVALVIGNSNYDSGPLKNPVHDAELMKQTLEALEFEVYFGTNLSSKTEMLELIRQFGKARVDYDVAFVYYAGHGIQIGSENFLLPTQEIYESEFDVQDFGVSVQNIIRYLNSVTDKVNVFVLDACRNNPFEHQWNQDRSVINGSGLAKMAPPTGSLIAFSTEPGKTASDGSGRNSVYCQSLSENMLLEEISLDQIFRNVRADVLKLTNENQRPIESSQLTGETFYLIPPSNEAVLSQIDALITRSEFGRAEKMVDSYLLFQPQNAALLTKRGHIKALTSQGAAAYACYSEALANDSGCLEAINSSIWVGSDQRDLGITSPVYVLPFIPESAVNKVFDQFIAEFPENDHILLRQARHFIFSGDSSSCLRALEIVRSIKPGGLKIASKTDFPIIGSPPAGRVNPTLTSVLQANMTYIFDCLSERDSVLKWSQINHINDPADPWPFWTMGNAYHELSIFCEDSVEEKRLTSMAYEKLYQGLIRLTSEVQKVEWSEVIIGGVVEKSFVLSDDELAVWLEVAENAIAYVESAPENFPQNASRLKAVFRAEMGCIERVRGNHLKSLRHLIKAAAETQYLRSNPTFENKLFEYEIFTYMAMEETEMLCDAYHRLLSNYNEGIGEVGVIIDEKWLIDLIDRDCSEE
jgi:tetratricopeptide (TPR) repeat protein